MIDTGTNISKTAFAAALAVVVIGLLVLIGWFFHLNVLKSVLAGTVTMNPATAVAMILAGVSLALSLLAQDRGIQHSETPFILAARVLAIIVALIGLMRLAALCGWDIGVDQWLFPLQVAKQLPFPSRIAPNVAFNFVLIGGALLFVDRTNRGIRLGVEFAAIVAGCGALLAFMGYAFNTKSFYSVGPFIPMALNTAISFVVIITGILLSHTDRGLLAIIAGKSAGASTARRLLPAAILLPAVLGLLRLKGEQAGFYDAQFGVAIFAMANILIFTLLVCRSAVVLFRIDFQRKQIGEVLHQQQTQLRALFDLIPAQISFKDTKNCLLRVNKRLAESVGKSVEEIEGRSALEIYQPEAAAKYYADDLDIIRSGTPKLGMIEAARDTEGKELWIQRDKVPYRDQTGNVVGIVVMVQDITERKSAEESLLRSQALLYMAGRLGRLGAWAVELPEYKQIWSDEVCAIYGVPPGTSLPVQETIDRYDSEFHETITHAFEACARDGTPYDIELQMTAVDDREVWVRAIGEAERDAAGVIRRVQGALQDITERKQLEERLFQSQKMETVGKLAGGVAHEFNSILTAIIGQSELLLQELPPENSSFGSVTEISKAANRAAGLTRQLLAYGRKQILQPKILDLNSVLLEMESTLRHLIGRDVDMLIVPAAGLSAVKIDPGQVQQVIANLVMNAADAMLEGGKLTLETANVSFDQMSAGGSRDLQPGGHVMLAITDTGTGMSEEVRARIFEPFFTTKSLGQGMGLGLSTCYGIIKQSGGHIDVYSEPGLGTAFKIYLPQAKQPVHIPIASVSSSNSSRGTETILLAEDDPALREMATALLRGLGYTVLAAADGREALSLKQQNGIGHVDLLFTDIVMPHMGGKELADRVQELSPHTRILFTSGYTANAIGHQGVLDAGVVLLQKPFTPSALAHKVREVLDTGDISKPLPTPDLKAALELSNLESRTFR